MTTISISLSLPIACRCMLTFSSGPPACSPLSSPSLGSTCAAYLWQLFGVIRVGTGLVQRCPISLAQEQPYYQGAG